LVAILSAWFFATSGGAVNPRRRMKKTIVMSLIQPPRDSLFEGQAQ